MLSGLCLSQPAAVPHGHEIPVCKDQVIRQNHIHSGQRPGHTAGGLQILPGGDGDAAGVVVGKNYCGGVHPQGEFHHTADPKGCGIRASLGQALTAQRLASSVQGKCIDLFLPVNVTSKEQVILNTWYGGEMKKGLFSMQNYFLPLNGMASMHCSANTDMDGKHTAIFFGLSGTGKTTLSTDPKRRLIGDDEHGWDDNGVFNLEGGCYAKVINLDKESEPDIYNAIKRDALLENVTVDANGKIDFASS